MRILYQQYSRSLERCNRGNAERLSGRAQDSQLLDRITVC